MAEPAPPAGARPRKLRLATCSLAGCFGCHMSFLDLDERLLALIERVELDRSPFDDLKHITAPVDVGLVEGGVCNADNVHVLRDFRRQCEFLVAVGECAATGGIPSLRNSFRLADCLRESFGQAIPNDPELPLLLDKVYPIHQIVRIDFTLPGCPPSADLFWQLFDDLLAGRTPRVARRDIHFD
jgi:NAD-reducing hydrogenase small subunit